MAASNNQKSLEGSESKVGSSKKYINTYSGYIKALLSLPCCVLFRACHSVTVCGLWKRHRFYAVITAQGR